jgi:hypothetical protein
LNHFSETPQGFVKGFRKNVLGKLKFEELFNGSYHSEEGTER